jgi:hypothetical protein
MNGLSWLIYLAGATGSLSTFFTIVCVIAGILTAVLSIVALVSLEKTNARGVEKSELVLKEQEEVHRSARKWAMRFGLLFFLFGVLNSILPDRRTVLLIAASEIGERTLKSDQMAAVGNRLANVVDPGLDLLNTWISKQTQDLRREMEGSNNSQQQGARR